MSLALHKISRRYLLACVLFIILFTLMISPRPVKAAAATSDAWAGYYTQGSAYTEVNMYFTVPTLTATAGKTTAVYTWAGLQGTKHLVQAGIDSIIDSDGHQTDFAWWYICCGGAGGSTGSPPDMGLAVNPGDKIWVYVGSNADGDGYDGFLIENLTQGTSQTHYEYGPDTFAGDNASASCVAERQLGVIANFGTLSITGCGVYTNGQGAMVPIGSVPGSGEDMAGGNTTLVSTSALRNGADFDLTWENTGIGLP